VQVEGLLGAAERLAVAALPLKNLGQAEEGVNLAGVIAELPEQIEGVPEVSVGVVVAAQSDVGEPEVAVGVGLPGPVGQVADGG
jgi:hypothetical protein